MSKNGKKVQQGSAVKFLWCWLGMSAKGSSGFAYRPLLYRSMYDTIQSVPGRIPLFRTRASSVVAHLRGPLVPGLSREAPWSATFHKEKEHYCQVTHLRESDLRVSLGCTVSESKDTLSLFNFLLLQVFLVMRMRCVRVACRGPVAPENKSNCQVVGGMCCALVFTPLCRSVFVNFAQLQDPVTPMTDTFCG